jgi:hypothetical protein
MLLESKNQSKLSIAVSSDKLIKKIADVESMDNIIEQMLTSKPGECEINHHNQIKNIKPTH